MKLTTFSKENQQLFIQASQEQSNSIAALLYKYTLLQNKHILVINKKHLFNNQEIVADNVITYIIPSNSNLPNACEVLEKNLAGRLFFSSPEQFLRGKDKTYNIIVMQVSNNNIESKKSFINMITLLNHSLTPNGLAIFTLPSKSSMLTSINEMAMMFSKIFKYCQKLPGGFDGNREAIILCHH